MDWIEYSLVALLVLHVVQLFLIHRLRRVIAVERMVTNQQISNLAGICRSEKPVVQSTDSTDCAAAGPWINGLDAIVPTEEHVLVEICSGSEAGRFHTAYLSNYEHYNPKLVVRWAKINV